MDRQIKAVLNQQVSIEKFEGKDGRNVKTYELPIVVPCYIGGEVKMVRNAEGQEVVSTQTLYFSGSNDVIVDRTNKILELSTKDKVVLPDGRQPPIIGINPFYDEKGCIEIVEVYL